MTKPGDFAQELTPAPSCWAGAIAASVPWQVELLIVEALQNTSSASLWTLYTQSDAAVNHMQLPSSAILLEAQGGLKSKLLD